MRVDTVTGLRRLGKTAFACAYAWTGGGRLRFGNAEEDGGSTPFLVGYHRVVENFRRSAAYSIPSMLISTRMLERHVDWLAKRYDLVSVDDIAANLQSGHCPRKPTAAVTFDDGYRDVYYNAYPLLRRKGIPAAVFVVTGSVGSTDVQVYDKLYVLLSSLRSQGANLREAFSDVTTPLPGNCKDPFSIMTHVLTRIPQWEVRKIISTLEERVPIDSTVWDEMVPMTWKMISEMHRNGFTIGSHTKSHTLLPYENSDTIARELKESRRTLELRLKTRIAHFAYPDGRFNPAVIKAVDEAGYKYAYTICRSRDLQSPLLTIPRKVLWERSCINALGRFSSAIMKCQSQWVFDSGSRCEHDHSTIRQSCGGPSGVLR